MEKRDQEWKGMEGKGREGKGLKSILVQTETRIYINGMRSELRDVNR